MENNAQVQEWMERMEKSNRQQVRWARLQCLFALIAAGCCAAVLLIVLSVVPQMQQMTSQVQSLGSQAEVVLTNLESVTSELAAVDLESMVSNVDALVTSSQDGVKEALDKINALDIESLNQGIADLSAVVKPLADFFGRFS